MKQRRFASLFLLGGFVIVCLIIELRNVSRSHGEFLPSNPQQYVARFNDSINIQELITFHNRNQTILNYKSFGPVTNETILITIQVHNRLAYLTHLVDSLRAAQDISNALLIFSHDVYDDALNQLIEKIDFCMVMQIFYPYSIKTHPMTFPGSDPNDCQRNTTRLEAKQTRCHGGPDTHGHYREAKFTQMKHHWWWKLNQIFDKLEVTKHHSGFLLLLEEDYFVVEDFIPMLKLMQETILEVCELCNIISLGTYSESLNPKSYDVIDVNPWITHRHNMGMAFTRSTWNSIKKCARHFCEYDEYNYDFSLQNVNRNCLEQKLLTAMIRGPRVFHIGECGIHHVKKVCKSDDKVKSVKLKLKDAKRKKLLYPTELKLGRFSSIQPSSELKPNGGWGDERDRNLCLNMTV